MTIPRQPEAVLCDVDGVIRFVDHGEVRRLEEEAGLSPGTTAAVAFADGTALRLVLGALTRDQWATEVAHRLTAAVPAARARALAAALTRAPARVDATVVGILRKARKRVPVLLVSNATLWLEEDLAAAGLGDLAEGAVNSARVGVAKPDPEIFHVAARRAGVAPDRCLFVDDGPANVAAAARLGMTAVDFREPADLRRALAPLLEE
ncbi:HAD-IA family hydrolase [Kitasatospora sp. NPDC058406]|uniref:HAD-IA family hydrolase n=1 Tax=Kitasatospora sp. NPDC058406 TaxID=3346483 RepID=UPI0036518754